MDANVGSLGANVDEPNVVLQNAITQAKENESEPNTAIEIFQNALKAVGGASSPDQPNPKLKGRVHRKLANMLFLKQRLQEGKEELLQAQDLRPGDIKIDLLCFDLKNLIMIKNRDQIRSSFEKFQAGGNNKEQEPLSFFMVTLCLRMLDEIGLTGAEEEELQSIVSSLPKPSAKLVKAHCRFGEYFLLQKEYDLVAKSLKQALEAAKNEKIKPSFHQVPCLLSLGEVEAQRKEYGQAIAYCVQALKIAEVLDDQNLQASCLLSLGEVELQRFNHGQAIDYCAQALKIAEVLDDQHLQVGCLFGLSRSYYENKQCKEAVKKLIEAQALAKTLNGEEVLQDLSVFLKDAIQKGYAFPNRLLFTFFPNSVAYQAVQYSLVTWTLIGGLALYLLVPRSLVDKVKEVVHLYGVNPVFSRMNSFKKAL